MLAVGQLCVNVLALAHGSRMLVASTAGTTALLAVIVAAGAYLVIRTRFGDGGEAGAVADAGRDDDDDDDDY